VSVIEFEYVDIPTLIKLRAARTPAPRPYKPRPCDTVEYEADDHVQQVTLASEG
jgi:hypothetical protein